MSIKDKLFLISLAIQIFMSFGIAGNIELDLPVSKGSIIIYLLSTAYCFGRIAYFDLYESKE